MWERFIVYSTQYFNRNDPQYWTIVHHIWILSQLSSLRPVPGGCGTRVRCLSLAPRCLAKDASVWSLGSHLFWCHKFCNGNAKSSWNPSLSHSLTMDFDGMSKNVYIITAMGCCLGKRALMHFGMSVAQMADEICFQNTKPYILNPKTRIRPWK